MRVRQPRLAEAVHGASGAAPARQGRRVVVELEHGEVGEEEPRRFDVVADRGEEARWPEELRDDGDEGVREGPAEEHLDLDGVAGFLGVGGA